MADDPTFLSPDDLEAHVVWLRRLARSLVGDEHAADDLAQETWVRALEHRPATDRSVTPWLTVVARNLARMARRSAARRGTHRPLDEHDARAPATGEVVARAEAARRLVEAVTELDEPFRTTVWLRYAEGLSGAEIARRTGVPDGTVRWRLKRGLDGLRSRLDVDGDRGGRAVGVLLLPLGRSEASGAGASALVAGGVVMGPKAIAAVVLGVALVGAAGWLASRSGATPPAAEGPAAGTAASAVESDDAKVAAGATGGARAEIAAVREVASAAPADARPSEGTVVRVIDAADRPVSGATVTLGAGERETFSPTATTATTDEAGAATLALTLDEDATVFVDHPAFAPTVERLKAREAPVVVLRASAALSGVVRTFETRAPIAGARVSVGWSTWGSGSPLETTTDHEGRYRLPRVPVEEEIELVVRRPEHVPHAQAVRIERSGEERLDVFVPAGVTLRARVIDEETGRPLGGVRVDAGRRLETDEEGRVVLRGLVTETPVAEFRKPGYCVTNFMPDRSALRDGGEIEIEMVPACVLRGEVRGAASAEPGGWTVFAKEQGPSEAPAGVRVLPGSGAQFGKADAAGRFRLEGLVPGKTYEVTVRSRERALAMTREVSFERPGEVVELVLDEPRFGSIEGAVRLLENGPGRHVRWAGARAWGDRHLGDATEFRIDEVEAGRVELELAYGDRVLSRAVVLVREGATTRYDFVTAAPTARVGGVVRRPSGEPVSGVQVALHPLGSRGRSFAFGVTDADGRFAFRFAADTATDLEIQYDWTLETFFLEPHAVRVGDEDVDLVLPRVGHPRLRIVDADTGVPLPRVLVGWRMELGDRTIAPYGPSPWRPGLHGVAPHRLPVGPVTLVLDATLLGYDVTEIDDFLVPSAASEGVREIRLRPRR